MSPQVKYLSYLCQFKLLTNYIWNACSILQFLIISFTFYRLSPSFCICGDDLGISVDPTIINVQKTRYNLRFSQTSSGIFSGQDFEFLLRSVRFAHDPIRPLVDRYSASVSVTAYDETFVSRIAYTDIDVSVFNIPPMVLIDGITDVSAVMTDGEPTISLLRSGVTVTVFEDTTTVERVSITLTNPSHNDEQILISAPLPSNFPSSISISSSAGTISFTGPATPADFSQALTDVTILYRYPPMESILQGDEPIFTTRLEFTYV